MTTPYQTLLLVDDDSDDHEIFLTALKNIKADVFCTIATNGRDALKTLETSHVNPDLIFLDINMPLMSGVQFLTELKKIDHLKHIPVIIYTTTTSEDTVLEMKTLGAHHFISKPETFSELEGILKDILRGNPEEIS